MKEFYHKWYSQYLSRDIEMLVFGESGYPVIFFPSAKGRYYETKDSGLIDSAAAMIDQGRIKIYCPDGIDELSWYNYDILPGDRVKTHLAYERMVLNDVIGFAKFETGFEKTALAGCGFGGYHAVNLAFRHPDSADYLISMGGFFDIKRFIMGYYDDECYYNNPFDYMPNLTDERYLSHIRKMKIILGIGEWDPHVSENERLSEILSSKGVVHKLEIKRWASDEWKLWKEIFPDYLSEIPAAG